jgi:hypothetical protein
MEINRKIVVFIAGLVLAGTLITIFFPKEDRRNSDAPLRIGAGADISGILMEETVEELNGICMIPEDLESSSFQDC